MFCEKCGNELPQDGVVCPQCGYQSSPKVYQPQPQAPIYYGNGMRATGLQQNFWAWLIGAAVSFFLSVVMTGVGFFKMINANEDYVLSRDYSYLAFFILTVAFVVLGVGFLIIYYHQKSSPRR